MTAAEPSWRDAHRRALDAGEASYVDPETGFHVFTEVGLRERGRCCGSGCRHCPYQPSHSSTGVAVRRGSVCSP